MKFTGIRVAMAALCMLAVAGARTRADDESKADSKKLAAQTEKLLEAYNKDDVKASTRAGRARSRRSPTR